MIQLRMDKEFFKRDVEIVARDLLGKILVRRINGVEKRARIVETEAYFEAVCKLFLKLK